MGIEAVKSGAATVITIAKEFGQLNEAVLPQVQSQVRDHIDAADPKLIVLNMSHVEYFTSSFITFLLQQNSMLDNIEGGGFGLAGLEGYALEILTVSRLDTVFKIFPTVEEAVTGLSA